ncbi:MAG: glycosyltransferase [Deltaproteobacteria bacterium]|nr:glycosyltransferase [Deltaproteobacteria bacterium]
MGRSARRKIQRSDTSRSAVDGASSASSISLCMIAKDEAVNLPRCLDSVRGVVDEMIVIDTGSTDATVEIAQKYGARVESAVWTGDFSAARNAALAHATGDWILVLDADEALASASRGRLRKVLSKTEADGLQIRIRNLSAPGELVAHVDMPLTRVFRNVPEHRFEGVIHEQIGPSIERRGGRIAPSDLLIIHYGYAQSTVQGSLSRADRNLAALKRAIADRPLDAYLQYQAGCTYRALQDDVQAKAALEAALRLDVEHRLSIHVRSTIYAKLAQIELARHEDREAVRLAKASLELVPEGAVALQILALGSLSTGDPQLAHDAFVAVRRQPNLNPQHVADVEKMIDVLRTELARGRDRGT